MCLLLAKVAAVKTVPVSLRTHYVILHLSTRCPHTLHIDPSHLTPSPVSYPPIILFSTFSSPVMCNTVNVDYAFSSNLPVLCLYLPASFTRLILRHMSILSRFGLTSAACEPTVSSKIRDLFSNTRISHKLAFCCFCYVIL